MKQGAKARLPARIGIELELAEFVTTSELASILHVSKWTVR
jgi:hypothetical protein